MNKTLILDYSKWRCGGDISMGSPNILGKGHTKLENEEGYQCCIGQFSLKMSPELTSKDILNKANLSQLSNEIELFSFKNVDRGEGDGLLYEDEPENTIMNAEITYKAMMINDEGWTTPQQKINGLKELFGAVGYEIEVINQPLNTN